MSHEELCYSILCQDAYWTINKKLVRMLGLKPTLLLSDLLSKDRYFFREKKLTEDGFFYAEQKNIEKDTTLTPHEQRKCLNILKEYDLIATERRIREHGISNYFKLNHDNIINYLKKEEEGGVVKKVNEGCLKNLASNSNNKLINNNVLSKDNTKASGEALDLCSEENIPVKENKIPPTENNKAEDMPPVPATPCDLVEYWNSKKNLRTHKIGTKTYERSRKLFSLLKGGSFGRRYAISEEYRKFNNISTDDLYHKWVDDEIKEVIDVFDLMSDPEYGQEYRDKYPKSCDSFIYNPMTYTSFFMAVAKSSKNPQKKVEEILDQEAYSMYKGTFFRQKTLNSIEEAELIRGVNFVVRRQREYHEKIGKYFTPTQFRGKNFYRTHINFLIERYFDKNVFDLTKIGAQNIWKKYIIWVKQARGRECDLEPGALLINKLKFKFNNGQMAVNEL